MWYFLGVRLFKGELLAVKVKSNFKKKWVRGGVTKKRHGHNFDFSGLKRIAKVTHRVDHTWVIPCQICNFLLDRFKNGFFGPDPVNWVPCNAFWPILATFASFRGV